MDEDQMPFGEESIFYEYATPPQLAPEEIDPASNLTDGAAGLPEGGVPDLPSPLVGYESPPVLETLVDQMNIAFGIDVASIAGTLLKIILIVAATYLGAKMVSRALKIKLPEMMGGRKTGIDAETEQTFRLLVSRLLVAAIYAIGFLLVVFQIPGLSNVAVTLLAGAGVAAIAISFAAQDSISNVISGIFLAVFHPFRVGDRIDFNGDYGQVEDLTLRHTTILTWDGRRVFVPNSIMSNQAIVNWTITDPIITWTVDVGIAYDADIDKARDIMLEVAKRHPLVLKNRDIEVRVTELGDFAVNMRLLYEIPNRGIAFATHCEIREAVKKRFDKEGIEIPFPYRNLIIQTPEGSKLCPSSGEAADAGSSGASGGEPGTSGGGPASGDRL
jgi:small-conductance mechanosensitive channel